MACWQLGNLSLNRLPISKAYPIGRPVHPYNAAFRAEWFCARYYRNRYLRELLVLAIVRHVCTKAEIQVKKSEKKSSLTEKKNFNTDKRRKHHHWLVTIAYADGEKFGRVYTDKDKATKFADRQRNSPVVKSARVAQVS